MENLRRMTDPQFESLKTAIEEHKVLISKTFDEHKTVIKKNSEGIETLKGKINPIYDVVIEFKGFSKFVGRIKVIWLWLMAIAAAVISTYELIDYYLRHK